MGVSNSMVGENIGDYREIGLFIVNKSMINVDIDPSQIEIYDMKGGKRKDFELVGADEYDNKILKFKKKVAKRKVKNKVVVLTSSSCHPKVFVKEFCYFLMSCHQHCLGVNLLVQR